MGIRIKQLFQDNRTPTLSLYDHHISRLSNPIHRKQSQICHKQLSTSASRIDQPLRPRGAQSSTIRTLHILPTSYKPSKCPSSTSQTCVRTSKTPPKPAQASPPSPPQT